MARSSVLRFAAVTAATLLLVPAGFGQAGRGGTTPPPTTGGGSTGPGNTGTIGTPSRTPQPPLNTPNNTNPANQPQQRDTPQQPIFISGRVLLEDGTAPTSSITIERVCNNRPHAEGYTDPQGYFSFQLGQRNAAVLQDASESGPGFSDDPFSRATSMPGGGGGPNPPSTFGRTNTEALLWGCELRAVLAGYRSQSVSLAGRRPMDNPDIGVILLHRIGPSEGDTVSMSSLQAPKDARKAFEKAQDALKKKKQEEALKDLQKAVGVYPGYAEAWYELGKLQASRGDAAARESFNAALKADARFVPPYIELSMLAVQAKNWQELADLTRKATDLDAFDYPQAFFLNAVANYNLRNFEAAEKSVREAERLDTRHQYPQSAHLLGVLLADRRDYAGAAEQYRNYLKMAPQAADAAAVRSQLQHLEQVSAQGALTKKEQ